MMTGVTTSICKHASRAALAGLFALAPPALAQEDVTDESKDAMDVAMTPIDDLNLSHDPIPQILLDARTDPYANYGLEQCAGIHAAVADLDAVLGDDFDSAAPDKRERSVASVAQSAVGMLIPFRGIIREISGASKHEYEFRKAIAAGLMRRAYLKGLGEARGCEYPARPMPTELYAELRLQAEAREAAEKAEDEAD